MSYWQEKAISRFLPFFLGVLGLVVFLVGVTGVFFSVVMAPVAVRESARVVVQIPPGASTAHIAAILSDRDLIRSPEVFRLYTRVAGLDGALHAGEYEISPSFSTPEIVELLVQGRTRLVSFTVPEGLNLEQVATLLAERELGDRETFERLFDEIAAVHFLDSRLPTGATGLEGYLFPDTYLVSPGAGEEEIVLFMLSRFEEEIDRLGLVVRAQERGMTLHEAVTLASLIEREARVSRDRRKISGVLHNRLQMGMLLQVDATVIYALGDYTREVVLYADLEVDSPYNTYRHLGLPPGPIAGPGQESLLAAVEPEEHDYIYYVARPDGSHAFSRTLDEHNENKRRYLP